MIIALIKLFKMYIPTTLDAFYLHIVLYILPFIFLERRLILYTRFISGIHLPQYLIELNIQ